MFNPGHALGRAALSSIFVFGGQNAFRNADKLVGMVEPKLKSWGLEPLVEKVGAENLVKVNGGVMVAAGASLALGILPRLSSLALLGALVPTTVAGHAFWEKEGPARQHETIAFLSNVAAAGGLIYVASTCGKKKRCCKKSK